MRPCSPTTGIPGRATTPSLIAERADVELDFGKILLPHFPVPERETEVTYLRRLVEQGPGSDTATPPRRSGSGSSTS
jgi:DNA polymerase III alpha subunit